MSKCAFGQTPRNAFIVDQMTLQKDWDVVVYMLYVLRVFRKKSFVKYDVWRYDGVTI